MRISLLNFLAVAAVTAGSALPALSSPIVFRAAGQISGGGTLGGTVTIDTATGNVLTADLSVIVNQTFLFSTNVGGIPNYANSGLFVIAADDSQGGYPVALMGLAESSLVGYDGGPISPASNIAFANGEYFVLTSGNLALLSTAMAGSDTVGTFGATGTVAGSPLSGNLVINVTTGVVLSSSVTAIIPRTYKLSSHVGGIPNYANSGLFAIIANEEAGGYPVAILGLDEDNLIGYPGGPISGSSGLFLADGTRFEVSSASLTAVPEPSTFACIMLAGGLTMLMRRRL
jgi:hypothetical protein